MALSLNRWGNTAQDGNFRNKTNENWDKLEQSYNGIEQKVSMSDYSIVVTTPITFPLVTKMSGNISSVISLTFGPGSLYLAKKSGGAAAATYTFSGTTKIDMVHNSVLLWDLEANQLLVQDNNAARPNSNILLAYHREGEITDGFLARYKNTMELQRINNVIENVNPTHIVYSLNDPIVNGNHIDLRGVNLYAVSKNGETTKSYTSNQNEVFDLEHNEALIWNLDTNLITKLGNNDKRPRNFVLLAYVSRGLIQSGDLLKFSYMRELKNAYTHLVITNHQKIVVRGMYVSFKGCNIYAIGKDGQNIKGYSSKNTEDFTLKDNDVLIWDFDYNTFKVIGNNDKRPITGFVVMAYARQGLITDGEILKTLISRSLRDSQPITTESRHFDVTEVEAIQGLTVCKEEILVFGGSNSNHSDYANIIRWNKDDFTLVGTLEHNLGHAASVDYNHNVDVLMIANGETDIGVPPRLDFIVKAKETIENREKIDFLNEPNLISIEFSKDGNNIGGTGAIGCWGEQDNIAYIMVGQNKPTQIIKLLLGTGSNDLSISEDGWGNFLSGKVEGELNGTAKVLQRYFGIEYGTFQGLTFHAGYLYLGLTAEWGITETTRVLKIQCLENGTYRAVKTYEYPYYKADGSRQRLEQQGVAILDGRYVLAGYVGNLGSEASPDWKNGWYLYPLENKQGGKGKVGNRVDFKFKCNSIPLVNISPTSSTTDIYISELTTTGFKVESASGGEGTFNWECEIS